MTELLPCPFCGGKAHIITTMYLGGRNFRGSCMVCGSSSEIDAFERVAAEKWNTRPSPTVPEGVVAELEKITDGVADEVCDPIDADHEWERLGDSALARSVIGDACEVIKERVKRVLLNNMGE